MDRGIRKILAALLAGTSLVAVAEAKGYPDCEEIVVSNNCGPSSQGYSETCTQRAERYLACNRNHRNTEEAQNQKNLLDLKKKFEETYKPGVYAAPQ
jgi:hypothetical protein